MLSEFLAELERELGLQVSPNDVLPVRQDRVVKRIRDLRSRPTPAPADMDMVRQFPVKPMKIIHPKPSKWERR